MAISQKARKERAIKAMQKLGLSRRVVSVVLEKLLEVFENEWLMIECESYRALADAVLEWQEQHNRGKNKGNVSKREVYPSDEEEEEEGEEEEEEEEGEEFVSEEGEFLEPAIRPQGRALIIREPDSSSFRPAYDADSSDSEEALYGNPHIFSSNPCIVNDQAGYRSTVTNDDRKGKRIAVEDFSRSAMRASTDASNRQSAGIKRKFPEESRSPLKKPKIEPEEEQMNSSPIRVVPIASVKLPVHPSDKQDLKGKRVAEDRSPHFPSSLGSIADCYSDNNQDENVLPETLAEQRDNNLIPVGRRPSSLKPIAAHNDGNENSKTNPVELALSSDYSDKSLGSGSTVLYVAEKQAVQYFQSLDRNFEPSDILNEKFRQQILNSIEMRPAAGGRDKSELPESPSNILTLKDKPTEESSNGRVYRRRKGANLDTEATPRRSPRFMKNVPEALNAEENKETELRQKGNGDANFKEEKGLITVKMDAEEILKCQGFGKISLDSSLVKTEIEGSNSAAIVFEPTIVTFEASNDEAENKKMANLARDVADITKGEEEIPVRVVNDLNSESFPPPFHYISNNIVYQNADVNISLAKISDDNCCKDCFGDCLDSPTPCICACKSRYGYVYTKEGLLKKEFLDDVLRLQQNPKTQNFYYCEYCPVERTKSRNEPPSCEGHLVRSFIKECWSKCGCSRHCGNRLVQRGIRYKLEVFYTSEGKGWGLRTLEDLPRGAFVCEYVGEVLTQVELYSRIKQMYSKRTEMKGDGQPCAVLLDAAWNQNSSLNDDEALCLDASLFGNVARFINHRCVDANLTAIPVEIESPDHYYYHVAFFTTREIKAKEELTWDYRTDFNYSRNVFQEFPCLCESSYCPYLKRRLRQRLAHS